MEENLAISNEPWKLLIERCELELRNDTRYEAHLGRRRGLPGVIPTHKIIVK